MIKKANIHPSCSKREEKADTADQMYWLPVHQKVCIYNQENVSAQCQEGKKTSMKQLLLPMNLEGVIFTQFEKWTYLKQISIFAKIPGLL